MAESKPNYNQDYLKLAGSTPPADHQVPDREKEKPANKKQKLGGGKHGRVNQPLMGRAEEQKSRRADGPTP